MAPSLTPEEQEGQKIQLRIEQLRALARSEATTEHERSAAAYALVRLLDKHDLVIVTRASVEEAATSRARSIEDALSDLSNTMRKKASAQAVSAASAAAKANKTTKYAQGVDAEKSAKQHIGRMRRGFARIASRYSGACKRCGESYARGDMIYWKSGEGAWHAECFAEEFGDDFDGQQSSWGGTPK